MESYNVTSIYIKYTNFTLNSTTVKAMCLPINTRTQTQKYTRVNPDNNVIAIQERKGLEKN